MHITAEILHDFTLFLLKDQLFDLTKESIAAFITQYRQTGQLIKDYYAELPQPTEGTAQVILVGHEFLPRAIDPLQTGKKKPDRDNPTNPK